MRNVLTNLLLRLYPPDFRKRFREEMQVTLCDARQSECAVRLYGDVIVSVARQWLTTPAVPVVICAMLGAFLTFSIGSRIPARVARLHGTFPIQSERFLFLCLALGSFLMVLLTTLFSVFWLRMVRRKRHA